MRRVEWQGMESRVSGTHHSNLQSKKICAQTKLADKAGVASIRGCPCLQDAWQCFHYLAMSVQACMTRHVHAVLKHLDEA